MWSPDNDRDLRVAFSTHPESQASSWGAKKDSALLSSRDGYLLEPTAWRTGSEASYGVWRDDSGLFSWPCRKKGPHLAMTGASRGFSPAVAPVSDFSRGMTGSSESLSCGARDVRSPCPLLLLPPIPPSIRVFSNESALRNRWPKYWSFSFTELIGVQSFQWTPRTDLL